MTVDVEQTVCHEWARHTVEELKPLIEQGAVALWALGATEQHGAHLVTGFDHVTAEAIVRAAATRLGDAALVLPTLPFGCSDYWLDLGGTLSLHEETMWRVILDVCRSVESVGCRNLVIVNGHSGNIGVGISAVNHFGAGALLVELVSYWNLVNRTRLLELRDVEDGFGHAGEFETAIGLELDGTVRLDCIPASTAPLNPAAPGGSAMVFHRAPDPHRDTRGGVIGDASSASPAVGAAVLEMATAGLVEHCLELRGRALTGQANRDGRP